MILFAVLDPDLLAHTISRAILHLDLELGLLYWHRVPQEIFFCRKLFSDYIIALVCHEQLAILTSVSPNTSAIVKKQSDLPTWPPTAAQDQGLYLLS